MSGWKWLSENKNDIIKTFISATLGFAITFSVFLYKENKEREINKVHQIDQIQVLKDNQDYMKTDYVNKAIFQMAINNQTEKFSEIRDKFNKIDNKLDRIENILINKKINAKLDTLYLWEKQICKK